MLTLKPFKNSEADFVAQLLKNEETYALVCGNKYGQYPVTAQSITDYYSGLSSAHPMTAFFEGRAVGHILVVKNGANAVVGSVIIDDAQRGKGLGKKMLVAALEYAFKTLGAREVSIGVFEQNESALSLYNSLGFKETARESRTFLKKECPYLWLKLKGEDNEHL